MKINPSSMVIGERIKLGAAILAISEALQHFYPEHAPAIGQLAIPVIFLAQILVVNWRGVTVPSDKDD